MGSMDHLIFGHEVINTNKHVLARRGIGTTSGLRVQRSIRYTAEAVNKFLHIKTSQASNLLQSVTKHR